MNALCVDRRQWRGLGVSEALGVPSDEVADAYVQMGVRPTYTCAPYLLDGAPVFGQQIAWAESNAVVFANSVLGARTMKYPDYLDILVAITGRAPNADCHVASRRFATVRIDVPRPQHTDNSFYPTLGYHIGKIATNENSHRLRAGRTADFARRSEGIRCGFRDHIRGSHVPYPGDHAGSEDA